MMTFEDFAVYCAGNKDLVREFNRLSGCHMGETRTPIEKMIDGSCGYDPDREAFPRFLDFVYECIWIPFLRQNSKEQTEGSFI